MVNPAIEEVTIGAGKFRAETLPGSAGTGNFDTFLKLNVNRNSAGGSGRSDLNIDLDLSLLAGTKQSDFIYFYVKMGGVGMGEAPQYPNLSFANDGGFDELRRDYSLSTVASVPEPSAAMLLMLAATSLVARRSRR